MAASEIGARKTTSVADGEALGAVTLGLVEGEGEPPAEELVLGATLGEEGGDELGGIEGLAVTCGVTDGDGEELDDGLGSTLGSTTSSVTGSSLCCSEPLASLAVSVSVPE